VDRFQGQEAPVVIYSMATSTPENAPRGMEFLYSLNRLNVVTSRAPKRLSLQRTTKVRNSSSTTCIVGFVVNRSTAMPGQSAGGY
jgi:superfamily I DNA and/or RNA helicase